MAAVFFDGGGGSVFPFPKNCVKTNAYIRRQRGEATAIFG
jgi:hypothetical protein